METKLKQLRLAAGLSQNQLAEQAQLHVQALSKLDRGDRDILNVRLETALKIANALNCSVNDLIY